MQDDPIRIDADFYPHQDADPRRHVPWSVVAVLVATAGLLGWLLASPYSISPEDPIAAVSTTTQATTTTTAAVATTTPPPTPAAPRSMAAQFSRELAEAIPGFTDKIVLLATPPESFKIMRWLPSEQETEVVLSLDRLVAYGRSPVGLDASESWFADLGNEGVLTVHSVPEPRDSAFEREVVGLSVGSAVWHDSKPGSLAWIACGRPKPGPPTLATLDVTDPEAEPVVFRIFEENCSEWSEGVSLERWNDGGFLVANAGGDSSDHILFGPDGAATDLASASPALVSDTDGRVRPVVPGLASEEPFADVAWSPDGTLAAVIIDEHWDNDAPRLRVTGIETGQALTEVEEHGAVIFTMAWSTDSRFLLYELWDFETETGALVVYDTATNATVRTPLGQIVDEIRTVQPAS